MSPALDAIAVTEPNFTSSKHDLSFIMQVVVLYNNYIYM